MIVLISFLAIIDSEAANGGFVWGKVFLKISQISEDNTCVKSLFNQVAGLQACNFIKKRPQHRCLPVKFLNEHVF